MSQYKVLPITVTRDILTACDNDAEFSLDFRNGALVDESCSELGAGTMAPEGAPGVFTEDGYVLSNDTSATSFNQQGVYWGLPLNSAADDLTVECILTVDNLVLTSGLEPSLRVMCAGQSQSTANYLWFAMVDPFDMLMWFSLSFVGQSATVPLVLGAPIHFVVQKPATVSAGTPERYFINGVHVLSRDTRHTGASNVDTLLFGGSWSSAPEPGSIDVTYVEARVTSRLLYPTDGSSFTPPERLIPPRLVTGLGDPVVVLGTPITVTEEEAEQYTPQRASPWLWSFQGFPISGETSGTATENAPAEVPESISWQVDFPPYPGETPPEYVLNFDSTTWDITANATTTFRNRSIVADGVFIPRLYYTDPSWAALATTLGEVALSAAAAPDCAVIPGFTYGGTAQIGKFLAPPTTGACPTEVVPDGRTSGYTKDGSDPVAADFSVPTLVGKQSDQFTLTIESVGTHPMTISDIEWTGWYFNNTRRI